MIVKPGDKLFCVTNGYGGPQTREVEVESVGRKWAYLKGRGGDRFDIKTGRLDGRGFTSNANVYFSEADWCAETEADALFIRFRQSVSYARKQGITVASITEAAKLLGVAL